MRRYGPDTTIATIKYNLECECKISMDEIALYLEVGGMSMGRGMGEELQDEMTVEEVIQRDGFKAAAWYACCLFRNEGEPGGEVSMAQGTCVCGTTLRMKLKEVADDDDAYARLEQTREMERQCAENSAREDHSDWHTVKVLGPCAKAEDRRDIKRLFQTGLANTMSWASPYTKRRFICFHLFF